MKTLFTVFLVLNFLAEALAAASLIGGPEGLAAIGNGGQWSMHYGFAVVAIASAGIWLWPYRNNYKAVTAVLGILLTFHACVLGSLFLAGDQQVGVVIHSVLTLLAAVLFTQRSRWCSE